MLTWTNDRPTIEGWYLWRTNVSGRGDDPLHWHAYYFEPDMEYPVRGQWAGPIPEPQ